MILRVGQTDVSVRSGQPAISVSADALASARRGACVGARPDRVDQGALKS